MHRLERVPVTFCRTWYPGGMKTRRPYPTDVSDEEWYFAAPCLTLMNKDAPQRRYELREMFNALRWIVRAGAPWRLLPNDFPPWELVYQQTQRRIQAGCFEAMVNDLRSIIRIAQERRGQPSAVILAGRTLQSTCESGPRAGYVGYKRKRRSKVHMAVDERHGIGMIWPNKQDNFSFDCPFLCSSYVAPFLPVSHASPARLSRPVPRSGNGVVKRW